MGQQIRMYATRRLIDLAEPTPEQVDIADIAHGLSQVNRFTGHTLRPYSVAEHSVMVSWFVPEDQALEALLHDASEAYLGDVSSPLKAMLPEYRALEARWMAAVCDRFALGGWQTNEIKLADGLALTIEMSVLVLRHSDLPTEALQLGQVGATITRMKAMLLGNRGMAPKEAQREFLERFHELMAKKHLAQLDEKRGS